MGGAVDRVEPRRSIGLGGATGGGRSEDWTARGGSQVFISGDKRVEASQGGGARSAVHSLEGARNGLELLLARLDREGMLDQSVKKRDR